MIISGFAMSMDGGKFDLKNIPQRCTEGLSNYWSASGIGPFSPANTIRGLKMGNLSGLNY